jgi:hypothetical protein
MQEEDPIKNNEDDKKKGYLIISNRYLAHV